MDLFLSNIPQRNKGNHFKGEADHRSKPMHYNGKHIFCMIKDLKVVFGKGLGSQLNSSENRKRPIWKKSIFWDVPYWEFLEVHNTIDMMHLTKNLCVNLLSFLGTYGRKTKKYTKSMTRLETYGKTSWPSSRKER